MSPWPRGVAKCGHTRMAIASSTNPAAWSTGIAVTTDTLIQAQGGSIRVTWDGSAAVGDGMLLESGQAVVVPAGVTFRWAPAGSSGASIFYEEFGV